jgi:cob(I)alamin adenosyltransferase
MTRFYTKKGDDGYTGLLGKGRIPKYDRCIDTIGVIDEANSAIALARSLSLQLETSSILISVQRDLYAIMSEIAATPENSERFRKINNDSVSWLETQLDRISDQVSIPDEFIVPGDSRGGAALDLARTVVRRAERQVSRMILTKKIENLNILHYLNRLSSLCFILELYENQAAGKENPTLAKG